MNLGQTNLDVYTRVYGNRGKEGRKTAERGSGKGIIRNYHTDESKDRKAGWEETIFTRSDEQSESWKKPEVEGINFGKM